MSKSRIKLKKPKVNHKDLSFEGVVGLAYQDVGEHRIEVDPNQTDKEYFLTYAHELFHLLMPDLSERQIRIIEKNYGGSLWKAVLRLKKKWIK